MATAPAALATEGEAIERKHFKDIRELLGVTTRYMVIGGVPRAGGEPATTMSSDAGHGIGERAAVRCMLLGHAGRRAIQPTVQWDDGADVAEVAETVRGGGIADAGGIQGFVCNCCNIWIPD